MQAAIYNVPYGWEKSKLSKSAVVVTGNIYEVVIPMVSQYEYRLVFMASSVFNKRINIEIEEVPTGQTVLYLPYKEAGYDERGNYIEAEGPFTAKWKEDSQELEYPYYSFAPMTTTNLKIIIDVMDAEKNYGEIEAKIKRGCCSIIVLQRKKISNF